MEPRRRKKMHQDGQADGGLGGGDGQHEHREHLAHQIAEAAAEKATRLMFTASRMSSIAIRMRMTFLRFRKMPSTPSVNRIGRDDQIMGDADHQLRSLARLAGFMLQVASFGGG